MPRLAAAWVAAFASAAIGRAEPGGLRGQSEEEVAAPAAPSVAEAPLASAVAEEAPLASSVAEAAIPVWADAGPLLAQEHGTQLQALAQVGGASGASKFCWTGQKTVDDWKRFCRAQKCDDWNHETPMCWKLNARYCSTGGQRWACDGQRQSPLYIEAYNAPSGKFESMSHRMHYQLNWYLKVENDGHSLMVHDVDGGHFIGPDHKKYQLLNFHLHTPSEHFVRYQTGGGYVAKSELHVVHEERFSSQKLVLAIRFVDGGPDHPLLSQLGLPDNAPISHQKKYIMTAVNLKETLQVFERGYFYYEGSLTTPPCTENVHWYVATEEVKVSEAQVNALSCLITSTGRDPEPKNGREFTMNMP